MEKDIQLPLGLTINRHYSTPQNILIEFPRHEAGKLTYYRKYPQMEVTDQPTFMVFYLNKGRHDPYIDKMCFDHKTSLTNFRIEKDPKFPLVENLQKEGFFYNLMDEVVLPYCEERKINYIYTMNFKCITNPETFKELFWLFIRGACSPKYGINHPYPKWKRRRDKLKAIEEL